MLLGISSFAYGWAVGTANYLPVAPLSEIDLINKARQFNVGCLQVGDNLPLYALSEHRLDELQSQARKNLIRIEIGARGLTTENLNRHIVLAARFHAPLLRFIIDGDDYEPGSNAIISIITELLPELEKKNITLGIENHDRFKAKELANLMDSIDSDHVGICLDSVNSMGAGEGLDYVSDVLAPYTVNLHIKDFKVERLSHKMGFTITGTPAGKGMTNVPMLMEKLSKYNRCQSAVLEQWVPFENALEDTIRTEKKWADESIAYLKSLPYFNSKF